MIVVAFVVIFLTMSMIGCASPNHPVQIVGTVKEIGGRSMNIAIVEEPDGNRRRVRFADGGNIPLVGETWKITLDARGNGHSYPDNFDEKIRK